MFKWRSKTSYIYMHCEVHLCDKDKEVCSNDDVSTHDFYIKLNILHEKAQSHEIWRCPSNTGFCCYPKQSLSFTHVWLALTISNQLRTVRFRRKVALFYDHSGVGIICHFQLELTKALSLCTQAKLCGYNWTFLTWHSLGKFTKSHRVTLVQLKCDFGQSKDPGDYTRLLAKQLYKCIMLPVRRIPLEVFDLSCNFNSFSLFWIR